jgi:hypothetical protein
MQVWWMKAYAVMLQSSQSIWFLQNWNIALHVLASWLCWPSTGGSEYNQGNAPITTCGCMDGFAQ